MFIVKILGPVMHRTPYLGRGRRSATYVDGKDHMPTVYGTRGRASSAARSFLAAREDGREFKPGVDFEVIPVRLVLEDGSPLP